MITTKYQQKTNKKLTTSIINITQIKRKIKTINILKIQKGI